MINNQVWVYVCGLPVTGTTQTSQTALHIGCASKQAMQARITFRMHDGLKLHPFTHGPDTFSNEMILNMRGHIKPCNIARQTRNMQ